jgi:hypothetical protein
VWGATAAPAIAQPPPAQTPPAQTPAPPKVWTVAVSAGLALASGNTDTSTINAAYDIVYDPKTKNVVKSDALYAARLKRCCPRTGSASTFAMSTASRRACSSSGRTST